MLESSQGHNPNIAPCAMFVASRLRCWLSPTLLIAPLVGFFALTGFFPLVEFFFETLALRPVHPAAHLQQRAVHHLDDIVPRRVLRVCPGR